jgi:hypothetical protein
MTECRVCGMNLDGKGRYNDHILLADPKVTKPICVNCAQNNPDEHHKKFKKLTEKTNFANNIEAKSLSKFAQPRMNPIHKSTDVEISEEDLNKVCNCRKELREERQCRTMRMSESCEHYRRKLVKKFPVCEPVWKDGREMYPIAGGLIPKKTLDAYTQQILDRLQYLNGTGRKFTDHEKKRPLWRIGELEEERRALHIALLAAAGFVPYECSLPAIAFKIIIEEFVEERCRRFGALG